MSCEYDGCTQTCRGKVSDAEDYCNVLRAYRKGKADERKKVLEDICNVLSDEIWNRPKTKDDHMHNHCIKRCIALVKQLKGEEA